MTDALHPSTAVVQETGPRFHHLGSGRTPPSSENSTRQALGTAPHAVSPPQMGGTLFIRDPCFSASALAGYSGVGSGDAGDPGAIMVASQAPQQDGGRIRFGHRQRSRVDTLLACPGDPSSLCFPTMPTALGNRPVTLAWDIPCQKGGMGCPILAHGDSSD